MLGVYAVKVDRKEKTQRQWWRFLKDFKEMRLGQSWGYGVSVCLSEGMDVCEEECAKGLEGRVWAEQRMSVAHRRRRTATEMDRHTRVGAVTPPLTRETPGRLGMELGDRG